MQCFVEENQFREQQNLQGQIFEFGQRGIGYVFDKFTNGGGYVEEQIIHDQSLHSAIQSEASNFVALLSNKLKLVVLLGADVTSGKMNQYQQQPKIEEIQEIPYEKNDNSSTDFLGEVTGIILESLQGEYFRGYREYIGEDTGNILQRLQGEY